MGKRQPGVGDSVWDDNPLLRRILKVIDQGGKDLIQESKSVWGTPRKDNQPYSTRTSAELEVGVTQTVEPDTGVGSFGVGLDVDDDEDEEPTAESKLATVSKEDANLPDKHKSKINLEEIDSRLQGISHFTMDGKNEPNQWIEHEKYGVCRKLDINSQKLPRINAVIGPGQYTIGGGRMVRAITIDKEIIDIHDDCYILGGQDSNEIALEYKMLKAMKWKGIAIYAKRGYTLGACTDATANPDVPNAPPLSASFYTDVSATRESDIAKLRNALKADGRDTAMSDDTLGKMMQESDDHADLSFKVERQVVKL